jgi:hypothetical protein
MSSPCSCSPPVCLCFCCFCQSPCDGVDFPNLSYPDFFPRNPVEIIDIDTTWPSSCDAQLFDSSGGLLKRCKKSSAVIDTDLCLQQLLFQNCSDGWLGKRREQRRVFRKARCRGQIRRWRHGRSQREHAIGLLRLQEGRGRTPSAPQKRNSC